MARIEERLKTLKLSEAKAATLAHLSADAIRNPRRAMEDGKEAGVSAATLLALAPVLQCTAGWLIDGTGPDPNGEPPRQKKSEELAANARRRLALTRCFQIVLDQIASHPDDREELADPAYRRQTARLLALGAVTLPNPDVVLGDADMARHIVELWFQSLTHQEPEQ